MTKSCIVTVVVKVGNKHIIARVKVKYVWLDIALVGSIFPRLWLMKIHLLSCAIFSHITLSLVQ